MTPGVSSFGGELPLLRKRELFGLIVSGLIAGAFALTAAVALGHEGGHGPAVEGLGKRGGLLAAVIRAEDAELGAKAKPVYIAELVRPRAGTVELHLYDLARKELKTAGLSSTSKVIALPSDRTRKPTVFLISRLPSEVAGAFRGETPTGTPRLDELTAMEFVFSDGPRQFVASFAP